MIICVKNDFCIFVSSDLDLLPLDLKFAPLVALVQRYVSTELEVSTAFLFREHRMHGMDGKDRRTDRQTNADCYNNIALCIALFYLFYFLFINFAHSVIQ